MSAVKRLHVLSQYAYLYLDSADVCVLGYLKGDVVSTNRNPQLRVYGRREFCMLPIARWAPVSCKHVYSKCV